MALSFHLLGKLFGFEIRQYSDIGWKMMQELVVQIGARPLGPQIKVTVSKR
jgi:hypothetical protein